MPSTFINLTNELLRKFNEVEITSEITFNSVRGVQAVAKDAIRHAVRMINQFHYEWPFNAYEHTQILSPGVQEYSWPDNFKIVEWESFMISKDDDLNVNTKSLKVIPREEWYRYARNLDLDVDTDGRAIPHSVFPSHGNGFGLTPSPDQEYTLKYRYFREPADLVNPTDEVIIPSQWDNVIISMATPFMHEFRSNAELAAMTRDHAMQQLKQMRGILINRDLKVYDGRVNLNHNTRRSGYVNV